MRALDRKLMRELWQLKGQMATIAMVVATGIMTVVTMRGGYDTLVAAQEKYYQDTHFAHVWVSLERAPESVRNALESIPGVSAVETRVTLFGTLDLPDLATPGMGRFVSVPTAGHPPVNRIVISAGRYLAPGGRSEVVVNKNFAAARGIGPGDTVRAVINGRARPLLIVGIADSPEHSYAVPPGALYPEDERYGVFWMGREALAAIYDMEGAFNEAALTLTRGASADAVMAEVDRVLERYGGRGAYPRERQPSHLILASELDQNRVMGTAIPIVFLAVAGFLLNLVLGRLIATQRTEIAVLKAFGYTNTEVGTHYLGFALVAVAVGALVGGVGGVQLGQGYIALYGEYFSFPELEYQLRGSLLLLATGASTFAAAAGALGAVRSAVSLPPAEAMRPAPPPSVEPGPLERIGLGKALPPAGRMILRNLERQPVRALLSSLGVAFSVAILVIGMFMFDGVGYMMDLQFKEIQREDLTVSFVTALPTSVRHELARLPGVTRVETFRAVPVRLRYGHRKREVGLQAIAPGSQLRRIVTADARIHPVPAEGVVLSAILARQLGVRTGETLTVEVLEGERRVGELPVAGVVDDFMGVSAYVSWDVLRRLSGGTDVAHGAYLLVAASERDALSRYLKDAPAVGGVGSPGAMLASFESQLAESLFIAVGFLLAFAGVISVAIIYNGARIALSERGRELASLRVMGFYRREVAAILLGEQAVVTLAAIPLGWALGWALSFLVVTAFESETYRIPLIITPRTYALAGLITLVAAAGSSWIVRRRINDLDLIAVLKTGE